jgi:hypothetical protein
MSEITAKSTVLDTVIPIEEKTVSLNRNSTASGNDAIPSYHVDAEPKGAFNVEATSVHPPDAGKDSAEDPDDPDHIIITGADAANYLLPLRDDKDPSVTFRGILLATCLSAFQAIMNQIYNVSKEWYSGSILTNTESSSNLPS